MSEDLIENLCEICGLIDENGAYPDFGKPENFVKLYELRYDDTRKTIGHFVTLTNCSEVCGTRTEFIRALCDVLEEFCTDKIITTIKTKIRQAKWK